MSLEVLNQLLLLFFDDVDHKRDKIGRLIINDKKSMLKWLIDFIIDKVNSFKGAIFHYIELLLIIDIRISIFIKWSRLNCNLATEDANVNEL